MFDKISSTPSISGVWERKLMRQYLLRVWKILDYFRIGKWNVAVHSIFDRYYWLACNDLSNIFTLENAVVMANQINFLRIMYLSPKCQCRKVPFLNSSLLWKNGWYLGFGHITRKLHIIRILLVFVFSVE